MNKLVIAALIVFSFTHGNALFGQGDPDRVDRIRDKLDELQRYSDSVAAREIPFEEKRYFPFRKAPVKVTGVLRMWKNKGISISYPKYRTLIIYDDKGVLMRKVSKDGSVRERAPDIGSANTIALLGAAFGFDQERLLQIFSMTWEESENGWKILMVPNDPEEKKLESVSISGDKLQIKSIVLSFVDRQRIEILPQNENPKSGFSSAEDTKYFRSENR